MARNAPWSIPFRDAASRVLIADDDAEMRRALALALVDDGFEVVEACDGQELLAALSALPADGGGLPDVIITDVRMPGCTGLEVLEAVRARRWPTAVIVMTAFGDRELHAEARRLSASAVFDKPFALDDLRTAVWNLARV